MVLFILNSWKRKIKVRYDIKGLTDGKHGFHIHTHGNLSNNCNMVCSHFNPDGNKHGGLKDTQVKSYQKTTFVKEQKLQKSYHYQKINIIFLGRVIHADEDDLGKGTGTKKENL